MFEFLFKNNKPKKDADFFSLISEYLAIPIKEYNKNKNNENYEAKINEESTFDKDVNLFYKLVNEDNSQKTINENSRFVFLKVDKKNIKKTKRAFHLAHLNSSFTEFRIIYSKNGVIILEQISNIPNCSIKSERYSGNEIMEVFKKMIEIYKKTSDTIKNDLSSSLFNILSGYKKYYLSNDVIIVNIVDYIKDDCLKSMFDDFTNKTHNQFKIIYVDDKISILSNYAK